MPDLISDGAEFSCPNCPNKLKLTVISSSTTGDSKKLANMNNNFFLPPGGMCSITMAPCVPATAITDCGQSTVKIDGQTALGTGCQFQCAIGGIVTISSPGQKTVKHDEAVSTDGLETLSLMADFTPVVGSFKSAMEAITGRDAVTGGEISRFGAILGVIPGGKVISKGGKVTRLAKKVFKNSGKKEKSALSVSKILQKSPGKYEGAPYHTKVDTALKSRAPVNGQKALDSSIQVKTTSPRRIGIDSKNGDFVVFDKTSENVYHGHVRQWNDLHPDMQQALQKAGKVTKNGKIIE